MFVPDVGLRRKRGGGLAVSSQWIESLRYMGNNFWSGASPSWITAVRYGSFSSSDSGGGFPGSGIAYINSSRRRRSMFGLSSIWKLARDKADFVVSIPAPIKLPASCRSRVADSSSGGRSDAKRLLNTVLWATTLWASFSPLMILTIWDLISCKWMTTRPLPKEGHLRIKAKAYILELKDWYHRWINHSYSVTRQGL